MVGVVTSTVAATTATPTAACFGAMGVSVLGDTFLGYPSRLG